MENPRNTTDPSLDPKHLTPDGKRKPMKINKRDQEIRQDNRVQDHANDIIPPSTITPKPKEQKHFWWEDD